MKTENTLFEQFRDFVNSIDGDQDIQNQNESGANSWDFCAIGMFGKSLGIEGPFNSFSEEVCEGQPASLHNRLNAGDFKTYGELQEYLAWL